MKEVPEMKSNRYELEINEMYCGCVIACDYSVSHQNEFVMVELYKDVYGLELYDHHGEVIYFIDNCDYISINEKDKIIKIDKIKR